MTINSYFKGFTQNKSEQDLIHNLFIESVQIHGMDVVYLPRTSLNRDDIFGEDIMSSFNESYTIEMYLNNYEGYEGAGDIVNKFGLELPDQSKFSVSIRRFKEVTGLDLPVEGDLLFLKKQNSLFQINFVDPVETFYQLGTLPSVTITAELYKFTSDEFNTGISEIDSMVSLDTGKSGIDPFDESDKIQTASDAVTDKTNTSPFGGF